MAASIRWLRRAGPIAYKLRRPALLMLSIAAAGSTLVAAPSAKTERTPPRESGSISSLAALVPPAPVPEVVPQQIDLPSLGVKAPVVPVGVGPDGAMGTPDNARDIAWWDGVAAGAGNALFAGHKDYNRRQGSFFRLVDLKPGDPIVVSGPQGVLTFVVAWVQQVDADTPAQSILGDQGEPVVTLITCGGAFDRRIRHYQDRIIVRGVLSA